MTWWQGQIRVWQTRMAQALTVLRRAATFVLACAFFAALFARPIAVAQIDEYQAKAVFLYKVASFVEWPAGTFKNPEEPLSVCIMGRTPFEQTFGNTVKDKRIEGHGFAVRQVTEGRQISGCHLLFVSASGVKRFRTVRSERGSTGGVLVVGESEGFTNEGGVINFKLVDGRFRVEINVAEAKREKLAISSRLLSMAEVVGR